MNVSDLIDPSFSYRLIATLMHFLWQGCLVALLAVLGDGLLSRASAGRRYALHVAALAIMVACVAITFSRIEAPVSAPAVPVESTAMTTGTEPVAPSRLDGDSASMPSTATPVFVGVEPSVPESLPVVAAEAVDSPIVVQERPAGDSDRWRRLQGWAPQIALLYFVCCGLLLARLIRGTWVAHRLRRMATIVSDDSLIAALQRQAQELGLRVLPRIAWCAEVSIPLVIGVLKPMILLPAAAATGLSADQLQALITHELAHIRRYDLLVNLAQRVVESMLFFHPAVWFISRRISNEREQACDELVLATGCERLRYADALVRMAELSSSLRRLGTSTPATSLAASGANSSEFKRRVLKVLSVPTTSHMRPSRIALLVIVVLIFGVTMTASRLRPNVFAENQPKNADDSPGKSDADRQAIRQQVDAVVDRFGVAVRKKAEFLDDEQLETLRRELRDYLLERVTRPVSDEWQRQVLKAVELYVVDVQRRTFVGPTQFMTDFEILKWVVWTALDRDELTPEQLTQRESQRKWFREFVRGLPDPSGGKVKTWTHPDGSKSQMTTSAFKLQELEVMLTDPLNPYLAWPFAESDFLAMQAAARRNESLTYASQVVFFSIVDSRWPREEAQRFGFSGHEPLDGPISRVSKRWPIKQGASGLLQYSSVAEYSGKNFFQWDKNLAKRPLSSLRKTSPQEEPPAEIPSDEAFDGMKEAERYFQTALREFTDSEYSFSDSPVSDVVTYLCDYHNIPIEFHPSAQASAETSVNGNLSNIEFGDALGVILHVGKLSSCIDQGKLLIASPEEARKRGGPFPRSLAKDFQKLQKVDASVRWESLLLGTKADSDTAAIPKLTALLGHVDVLVQKWAAHALITFGSEAKAAQPGLEKLTRSSDERVAMAAWQALIAIGREDFSTLPVLLAALDRNDELLDGDDGLHTRRLRTLLLGFDEKVWRELAKRYPTLSVAARRTLASSAMYTRTNSVPLLVIASTDPDEETRREVLWRWKSIISRMPAEQLDELVTSIAPHLKDPDAESRVLAASRLLCVSQYTDAAVKVILAEAATESGRELLRKTMKITQLKSEPIGQARDEFHERTQSESETTRNATRQVLAIHCQAIQAVDGRWVSGGTRNGLSTRLTPLTPKPQLGEPIKLKLELFKDDKAAPATFKFTQPARSPLVVLGPDGREMSPLARDRQPTETDIAVESSKWITLVNEIDLAAEYPIKQPGTYLVQWTQDLIGAKPTDAKPLLPGSNVLTIEVFNPIANGNQRPNPAAGSGDPRRAQDSSVADETDKELQRGDQAPRLSKAEELELFASRLRSIAPRDWVVERKDRAFRLQGPDVPAGKERAQILLWFDDVWVGSSDALAKRDKSLPTIGNMNNTRIGRHYFTRNTAAVELWPEFGLKVRLIEPVDQIAIATADVLQSEVVNRNWFDAALVRYIEIGPDGRRQSQLVNLDGSEIGITAATKFLVVGNLPNPQTATNEADRGSAFRHQKTFDELRAEAKRHGVRTISLADFERYTESAVKEGRGFRTRRIDDANKLQIPECLTTGQGLVVVPLPESQTKVDTAPPVGLEFIKPYPKLHGLSLDMTEPQFLEIVKQQELKTRKSVAGEKVAHHIDLGDGHMLIVMFDKDAKCSGIQRVRGEDEVSARPKAVLGRESFKGRVMIDGAIPRVLPIKVRPGLMLVNPRNDEDERRNEKAQRNTPVVEIPDDSLVISKDGGLANVAVYLKKAPANWKPAAPPETPVELRSEDHRFQPRMAFVRVGQPIRLIAPKTPKNEVHDFFVTPIRSNTFNMLVPSDSQRDLPQPFTKSEPGPIEVKSNLHQWQKAFLLAFDHPFAAITDAEGRFAVRDLPQGEHEFVVWHERTGYLVKKLKVWADPDVTAEIELKFPAGDLQEPEKKKPAASLRLISETGRLIDLSQTPLDAAALKALREERRKANDAAAAKKLVGTWKLTVSAKYEYTIEITQRADGCLEFARGTVLGFNGVYAFSKNELALIEPGPSGTEDAVFTLRPDGRFRLAHEQDPSAGSLIGSTLQRVPEPRAGRGSPDPALDPTAGLPNSDDETNPTNNANGDQRPKPAAGSGDPRRAQQPQSKESRALFQQWQRAARSNGNIPGGTLGPLVRVLRNFVKNNPTHEGAPKFAELLKRIEVTRDWSRDEAVKLLDEVAAIYPSLPEWVQGENRFKLGGDVVAGKPLPEELKNAPWGEAAPNGLRVAWLLEPRALKYRLGTPLKSRILFHNAGKNSVVFRALTWNQSGEHKAADVQGTEIHINSTSWTTIPMTFACRLAPGEFLEVVGAGIGVGANTDDEDWRDARRDFRVGSWIEAKVGDEVTFSPAAVHCDAREAGQPEGEEVATPENWWLKFISDRLSLDAPLPAAADERRRLLDRAVRDLFGNEPTPEEITALTTDAAPDALNALAKRLANRAGFVPFSGSLKSRTRKFLVLPPDPDAAKKPRSAKGPGQYSLGGATFVVTRRPIGERVVNEAHLSFSQPDATKPARKSHPVPLPDGYDSWITAWMRGGTVLWVAQKGADKKESIRRYDFTNPESVKETVIPELKPSDDLPQAILDALSPISTR